MVVWAASRPRSLNSSSTSRHESEYRPVPAHGAKNQLGFRLSPLEDRRADCLFHDLFRLPAAAKGATHPLSALIRNTEHLSQDEAVHTTAIDSMAENGRGYVQDGDRILRRQQLQSAPASQARAEPVSLACGPECCRNQTSETRSMPSSRRTTTRPRGKRSSAETARNSPQRTAPTGPEATIRASRANWFPFK